MRKRPIIVLGMGLLVAGGLVLARHQLSHTALSSVVTSPAPTSAAMTGFVNTASDPAIALGQLWDSNRFPQRLFVLSYVRDHARGDTALWNAARPWVLAAGHLADSEMQQTSLMLLQAQRDSEAPVLAGAYLNSPDPDVRLTGLIVLNAIHDPKFAAAFIAMLDDSEPRVQSIAATALRAISGKDFGPRAGASPERITEDIGNWKAWWRDNSSHLPARQAQPPRESSPGQAWPIALKDLNGRQVQLSDFRGKVVLVNFWATWCPPCVDELPALQALQEKHAGDLVVLAVNIDGIPEDHDDGDPPQSESERAATRAAIEKLVAVGHLKFPILLDPAGTTVGPYAAGALPVSVVIGTDGDVSRRILGARNPNAWEEIIDAAIQKPAGGTPVH